MNNRVRSVLEGILERFKTGNIPKAIAYATFPMPDIPSSKWSFTNRLIMILSDTSDARGIRQWNRVGRTVIKGAKAIYILVPKVTKVIDPAMEDGERNIVRGFLARAVFRVEDTEGEPLDHDKELSLINLPLLERAKQWGISVLAVKPFAKAYGIYLPDMKKILLASPEETVFFHELSHAAYERAVETLKPGQIWNQEIAAELSAQVLCHMVGKKPRNTLGNSYRYIESYASRAGLSPISACLQVLDCVEKIINRILGKDKEAEKETELETKDGLTTAVNLKGKQRMKGSE